MLDKLIILYGLKENVIVGKLIPAGTGIKSFRKRYIGDDLSDLERQAQEGERREVAWSSRIIYKDKYI